MWLSSLWSVWQIKAAVGTACPECLNFVGKFDGFVYVQLRLQGKTVEGFGRLLVSTVGYVA